jgi:hypothetical protein
MGLSPLSIWVAGSQKSSPPIERCMGRLLGATTRPLWLHGTRTSRIGRQVDRIPTLGACSRDFLRSRGQATHLHLDWKSPQGRLHQAARRLRRSPGRGRRCRAVERDELRGDHRIASTTCAPDSTTRILACSFSGPCSPVAVVLPRAPSGYGAGHWAGRLLASANWSDRPSQAFGRESGRR